MIEKMNEPAGPLFTALLFSLFGGLALLMLCLGLIAKYEEIQLKNSDWYDDCRSNIQKVAAPVPSDYILTQACFHAIRYGLTHNKHITKISAVIRDPKRQELNIFLDSSPYKNCGRRGCFLYNLFS